MNKANNKYNKMTDAELQAERTDIGRVKKRKQDLLEKANAKGAKRIAEKLKKDIAEQEAKEQEIVPKLNRRKCAQLKKK